MLDTHVHADEVSTLLFMVGDGVLDNPLTIPSLEGIQYSVSITLSW